MDNQNINQVKRVKKVEHSDSEVNALLAEGWILLNVYANSVDSDHGPAQYPVYVLGWTREEESPSETQARIAGERARERIERIQRAAEEEQIEMNQET